MTDEPRAAAGPLVGTKVVELAGTGPGPLCALLLSDMGADVVRVERADRVAGGDPATPPADLLNRGRRSIGVDLKQADGAEVLLELASGADCLIDPYRPGVVERLGVGPAQCLLRNPRLVYARMTGWGQTGPYAQRAGHDINYVALAGALAHIGRAGQPPTLPLNLVGDGGGGGVLLAFGIVCALLEAQRSGQGQVIDAAMVDGTALLMMMVRGLQAMGMWDDDRGTNLLDGGPHFYDVYETADGKFVSIGPIEPQFYDELLRLIEVDPTDLPWQLDRTAWPAMKARFADVFARKTRAEWCEILEGTDACFAPVLTMEEAPDHPHHAARETFVDVAGIAQPAPSPRFSRTPGAIQRPPAHAGQHTDEVLAEWGFAVDRLADLRARGAIA